MDENKIRSWIRFTYDSDKRTWKDPWRWQDRSYTWARESLINEQSWKLSECERYFLYNEHGYIYEMRCQDDLMSHHLNVMDDILIEKMQ